MTLLIVLFILACLSYDVVLCLWYRRQARLNREDVEFVTGCCGKCSKIDLKAGN
jgi:hypothetical protein